MENKKIFQFLGLCQNAGRLTSGETGCESAIASKKVELIILANDASENTKKKFLNSSAHYNIKAVTYADKISLGACIGKMERSVICIIDKGFAKKLVSMIEEDTTV